MFKIMYGRKMSISEIVGKDTSLIPTYYKTGWVHSSLLESKPVAKASPDERRRRNFIAKESHLEPQFKNAILEGSIMIGMTTKMVTASWGKPKDINRTVNSYSVHEQWIYSSNYLYFVDGLLKSWQE